MKTNYQLVLDEMLKEVKKGSRLLLHSCCGPCSSYVISYLAKYFEITVFYYNPNIYPESEFLKRLEVQKKFVKAFDEKIKVVSPIYDEREFLTKVKGLEKEKEGGRRCPICYALRLEKAFLYAKEHNFDYVTTTLTVSPYKHSDILNELGKTFSKKYDIPYLYSDFKKKDGYKKSIALSKEYDLYRQDYCGCRYSLKEKEEYLKEKEALELVEIK